MEDNVLKLPHIHECKVDGGVDDIKKKSYIVLTYENISIVEYYEEHPDADIKKTMMPVVDRARKRLAIALAAKNRREKQRKLQRRLDG
jgi:hypothetical protein